MKSLKSVHFLNPYKYKKLEVSPNANGELGIENIKAILGFIFELIEKLIVVIKNFNLFAAMAVVQEIVANLATLRKYPIALAEIRDLDAQEREELTLYFNINFDIPNDDLEKLVEEGVLILQELYGAVLRLIQVTRKGVNWYNSFGDLRLNDEKTASRVPEKLVLKRA